MFGAIMISKYNLNIIFMISKYNHVRTRNNPLRKLMREKLRLERIKIFRKADFI